MERDDDRARPEHAETSRLPAEVYAIIFRSLAQAVIVGDHETRALDCNDAALALFGYTREEFLRTTARDLSTNPGEIARILQEVADGTRSKLPLRHLRRKDGSVFPAEIVLGRAPTDQGEITFAVVKDISAQHRLELRLRESEQRLAHMLGSLPVALYTTSPRLQTTWASDGVGKMSGFPTENFTSDPGFWASRVHPEDADRVREAFSRIPSTGECETVYRWLCADGRYRWFWDRAAVLRNENGETSEFIGIWLDITERRERAEALAHARAVGEAATQVTLAQEAERQRVARELHDELGSTLTAALLELGAASGEGREDRLDGVRVKLRNAVDDLRRLTRGLHPVTLETLGIGPALEQLAGDFRHLQGVTIDLLMRGIDSGGALPKPIELAVYRIIQEALTNVVKHAGASSVSVLVDLQAEGLRVVVEDDGQGFDPGLGVSLGLGISGMRQRAVLVGGELSIEGAAGGGTSVNLFIPASRLSSDPSLSRAFRPEESW